MLTAVYENGESIANPSAASSRAVEVHQCADGEFEVCDRNGLRLTGPYRSQETTNAAARMISKGNQIVDTTERVLRDMKAEQDGAEARANALFPAGCRCATLDSGGDCDWCRAYYDYAL